MLQRIVGALLIVASAMATPVLAAMSAANPAYSQNLDDCPKKVVLLPPQVCVLWLSAAPPA